MSDIRECFSDTDILAYDSICEYGLQRGCTLFTLKDGGEWSYEHKNAYLDYGVETDRFYEVNLETQLYPDWVPANAS